MSAGAQDSSAVPIDTLTVTVPQASSVVLPQPGRIGVTLDEALLSVPGVFVNNRYNFALGTRISLRGFGSRAAFGVRGIRIIQDGIPLTMPDGQSNLNNVDLTSVGRIEVLRGAASMMHGNAAGGVIDIQSERPAPGFGIEARGVAASLGRDGVDDLTRFNVKMGGGSERTRYLVSAARADASGARDHSRFEQTNFNARVENVRRASLTAVTLSFADAPLAQNPGSLPRDSARLRPLMAWPRNIATNASESSRQLQGGVQHTIRLGSANLENRVYALTRTLDNPLPFAWITLDRVAYGARVAMGTARVIAAVDVERQSDDRREFANNDGIRGAQRRDQTDRIIVIAPSVRATHDITDRLNLAAGVRYDHARFDVADRFLEDGRDDSGERTMSAFSPAAGLTYRLSSSVSLFASVSTSFQTPTTTEMINAPPPAGEPCCAAGFNPLEPEKALAFEAGWRTRTDRLTFEAAAYHMRIRNAIVPFQVPQAEGRDFFRNAGRTRHQGLELGGRIIVTPVLQMSASYTWSDFVFLDDGNDAAANEGNRLPGVPPHHLVLRPVINACIAVIEPEAEIISSYFADDANTRQAVNDGAAIFNLRVRAAEPIGKLGLVPFAAINNATNRRYNSSVVINAAGARYFEPAPGRHFYIGLAVGSRNR